MALRLSAVAVLLGLGAIGISLQLKSQPGGTIIPTSNVLKTVSDLLLSTKSLGLKHTSCQPVFVTDVSADTVCFVSHTEPEALPALMSVPLDGIGITPGWTEDYGVPGAFYALKRDPKQVLGVAIKRIQGSRDFVKYPDLQTFASFISLTVNPPAKE